MSKMPEPVAIYKPEYGICWTSSGMAVEAVDGTQFITTTQAEAYKDACVREALELAADTCAGIAIPTGHNAPDKSAALECALAIRALIPPQQ